MVTKDAVYARFRKRGLDYHDRSDIRKVLKEFKPVIDGWYDPKEASIETGIDEDIVKRWSRNRKSKDAIGIKHINLNKKMEFPVAIFLIKSLADG